MAELMGYLVFGAGAIGAVAPELAVTRDVPGATPAATILGRLEGARKPSRGVREAS